MAKMKMIEMSIDDLFFIAESLATMLVNVKQHPGLIRLIPDDPQVLLITIVEMHARWSKVENPETPSKEAAEKAFQDALEALAKAAGK